jgi:hypothetical protein
MNRRIATIMGIGGCAIAGMFFVPRWLVWRNRTIPDSELYAEKDRARAATIKQMLGPRRRLVELDDRYQEAAKAVAAKLVAEQEDPKEFRATVVEEDDRFWSFGLWHVSAFKPEYKNSFGNPGGRCRTIIYDRKNREASSSRLWQ